MSAGLIFFPVMPKDPADAPAAVVPGSGSHDPLPDNSAAAHARRKLLDVAAFEQAERLAEGTRQAAFDQAARELEKTPAGYDRHNEATHKAEREYLEAVISAAERHGIIGGWKTTLATLPRPVPAQRWQEGKGKW